MAKSNLYGHSNKLDIPTATLERETETRGGHGLLCTIFTVRVVWWNLPNFILNSLKVQMRPSAVSIFPRSPALYALTCWLSFPLTRHISPSPHPAKPIRDLRASPPINYDPNQCRGLWYRIICQISADGWGQVPPCYRPYPCGNLCSGWALLMLPNLLMGSHCARQHCSPAAWPRRLLMFKHLSLTSG